MATSRKNIESPKPWEIIGLFFGYFAVAKDIPTVLRILNIPGTVPAAFKLWLLQKHNSPDFWLLLIFTFLVAMLYFWLLHRSSAEEPIEKDSRDKAISVINDYKKFRIIRSLGIVWLREKVLDKMKVNFYGTFPRQEKWVPEPHRFDSIDRITFKNGLGWEFQYGKDFKNVFIRTHPENDTRYGETEIRAPRFNEIKVLLIASNFFFLWFPLHIFRRIFIKQSRQRNRTSSN